MSPANIENTIKTTTPLAAAVAVIGDGRAYNVGQITLDPDAAAAYAEKAGIAADPEVLAKDPGLLAEIAKGVEAGNAKLSRVEQLKKYEVLPTFWMPGGDEMTPTMKLRRKPIAEKYADAIEALYA
jgi:long-subunit acyl-CoA synthetase (AMP-forming)